MKNKYETSAEIEWAIACHFGYRTHVIVPNITWGMMFPFELDLAIMTNKGYLYEVEIKTSRADLIRDKNKQKWKGMYPIGRIKKLWFAIPEKLMKSIEHIPERAGVLVVNKDGMVKEIRKPENNPARPLSIENQFGLARLGAMRIWPMKWNNLVRYWSTQKENENG